MENQNEHPTAQEIASALNILASVKDWSEVVDDELDGPDGRLEMVRSLASALYGLADEVADNIIAVAESELYEARKSNGKHARFMYLSAHCSELQSAMADAFSYAVVDAEKKFEELQKAHEKSCQRDGMTEDEYDNTRF